MAAYRREVDIVAGHFKGYQVEHIDQHKNEAADALSRLGSQCKPVPPNTFLDVLHKPSVKLPTEEDLAIPDPEAQLVAALPIISVLAENTLLKTAYNFLLLLVGFDTLTYRKTTIDPLHLWVISGTGLR